jgi:hypothetical protein
VAEDPYVYPGTDVLRNNFDIRDADRLRVAEADSTAPRIAALRVREVPGQYDLDHLRSFHVHRRRSGNNRRRGHRYVRQRGVTRRRRSSAVDVGSGRSTRCRRGCKRVRLRKPG